MTERQTPPFRADHVGSFLRPSYLLQAREQYAKSQIGAEQLRPSDPPVPRENLKDPVPCVAAGNDHEGNAIVAVCSVGVDLDLIPYAADARLAAEAAEPGARGKPSRLVVITPSRDRIKVTSELAGLLDQACELASL